MNFIYSNFESNISTKKQKEIEILGCGAKAKARICFVVNEKLFFLLW